MIFWHKKIYLTGTLKAASKGYPKDPQNSIGIGQKDLKKKKKSVLMHKHRTLCWSADSDAVIWGKEKVNQNKFQYNDFGGGIHIGEKTM